VTAKYGIKPRLAILGAALGALGALIALTIWGSQRLGEDLRVRLNNLDSESFGIASHFKDSLRELNNIRLRYVTDRDPADWARFLQAGHNLNLWLDQQEPKLGSESEKEALRQVRIAFAEFLSKARESEIPSTTVRPIPPEQVLAEFTKDRAESQHLFDVGEALAQTHYQSRNRLLAYANQRVSRLRELTLGLLALVFICGTGLAALAYRDLIAPLRVTLMETRALAERQEKLASLGMLAAGVAHEIRNPLTAVKAALFIQQKRLRPGTPEHQEASVVQREILRLERIVNDFLRFARPSDPEMAVVPADLPLKEVQLIFAPALAKSGIRLDIEPGASLHVRADIGQMKQVLINLVQNAVDSIGRDGTVTLRARADRRPLGGADADVVVLEVQDTGAGISPEAARRLFDPFFTTKDTGTGLGLPIAARIVEKHGGTLQYQTRLNRGTTFGIVLPRA